MSACLAIAGWARSETSANDVLFGERGQLVISSDFVVEFTRHQELFPSGGSSIAVTELTVAPALDYFVFDRWSLGLSVSYSRRTIVDTSYRELSAGPRLGYNLPLSAKISTWPTIGARYTHRDYSIAFAGEAGASQVDRRGWSLGTRLSIPFLVHPVSNFFIGLGPFTSLDVLARFDGEESGRSFDLGVETVLGGWL